ELAPEASYALAFDPLRQAALQAFGALGKALEIVGELPVRELPADVADAASAAQKAARPLQNHVPPRGLEPIQEFAIGLGSARDELAAIDEIVSWHLRHRLPWISRDGARFVLGRRANFDIPLGFHGFTVPSYFSLLEDLQVKHG